MGIVFRQSVKTSLVIFFGAFLGAVTIWLSTKVVQQQSFGYIRNLSIQAVAASQILLLGLNNLLAVYVHKYPLEDKRRKLLLSICLFLPIVVLFFLSFAYYFAKSWLIGHFQLNDQPLMARYYMLLPLFTILFMYQVILEQYLGSQMKVAIAAFMREVVLRGINILLILLYAFQYVSFDFLVIGSVLIYIVPVSIFVILAFRTNGFKFSFQFRDFSPAEYKEIIHFTWFHFLLTASTILIGYIDQLTLALYDHKGLSSVAVYGVAVFIISFLQIPFKGMWPATFTVLAQAITSDNDSKAKDIFSRSSINILIASVGMALLISCNLKNALLVLEHGYEDIIPIVLILFIGRFADLATGLNDAVISITNYYKFNFYTALAMIAILYVLIRILVPIYGVFGAAWATSIAYVLFNVVKFLFVWKKLDMQPFSSKTILVMVAGAPALAVGYFLPVLFGQLQNIYLQAIADASLRSILIMVTYLLMLLWLKPSDDLENYLASIKKNKRLF